MENPRLFNRTRISGDMYAIATYFGTFHMKPDHNVQTLYKKKMR